MAINNEQTKAGATELNEEELDQVQGGIIIVECRDDPRAEKVTSRLTNLQQKVQKVR